MSLTPGRQLGPYEIVAPLGAGGMGEVWRARDPRLGRDVAIKSLPEAFARDPARLARFEREAKLLAAFSHPNIAGIHGLEEAEGARYLVLEFVAGETLAARLARGPLPLAETLALGREVALALEAAHERGIVHRDLKPGNIMLGESGDAKVLDFGLAKGGGAASAESDPNLSASPTMTYAATQAGVILGTAAYMSPEQARGKNVDRRTDVWSFGCVLYECLTGRQVFAGETVSDLVAKILEREPDWGVLPDATPPRLRALLQRCLRKDAKERQRDMGDVRLELDEIAKGDGGAAVVPARTPPARLTLLQQIGIAILTAIIGVVATKFASREPTAPPLHVAVQGPAGQQLTDEVPDIAISPDGLTVAFVASDTAGVPRLWLRKLSSNQPVLLAGTEGARIPFWSPDSRNLAFFAAGSLKRIAVGGEGLQTICDAPNTRGGAWGAGDVIVFAPTASGPLLHVPANGGTPQPATTLDSTRGETAHRFPTFLPGGRRFLYVALPGKGNELETRLGTIGGPPGEVVATANSSAVYASPGYLVYLRQGTIFAQRVDRSSLRARGAAQALRDLVDVTGSYGGSPPVAVAGNGTLVQRVAVNADERVDLLDRSGTRLQSLALPVGAFWSGSLSPDGRQIAFAYLKTGVSTSPVLLVDLARGLTQRFTFEAPYETSPRWTADGRRVIYGSERAAGRELYWKRADGSGGEELLADAPGLFNDPLSATPDGRFLIFRSLSGQTGEDLWIVPLDGERLPKPLIQTRNNEMDAAVSPDGRWIAYRSDESGEFEVYVQSFPALDRKYRVSVNGTVPNANARMRAMFWRSDGREMCFFGRDGRTLMSVAIEPGAELRFSEPRPLLRLPREVVDLTMSPDGQRLFASVTNQTQGGGAIQLVMNWAGELKKQQ